MTLQEQYDDAMFDFSRADAQAGLTGAKRGDDPAWQMARAKTAAARQIPEPAVEEKGRR